MPLKFFSQNVLVKTVAFAATIFFLLPLHADKKYLSSYVHNQYIDSLTCKGTTKLSRKKIPLKKIQYGKSQKGKPLTAYIVPPEKNINIDDIETVYIIASQHGDERNAARAVGYFVRELRRLSRSYLNHRRVVVIPLYNPDGFARNTRFAMGKIDLNRDFPSSNGAKGAPHAAETKAFMHLIKKYPPDFIYNIHQPFRVVLYYPEDEELAQPFAILSDYQSGTDVGYPTPGSLGTWARENKIPTITVELSRSMKKSMAPFIYEEVRLALFHSALGCIPKQAIPSRLEDYLTE